MKRRRRKSMHLLLCIGRREAPPAKIYIYWHMQGGAKRRRQKNEASIAVAVYWAARSAAAKILGLGTHTTQNSGQKPGNPGICRMHVGGAKRRRKKWVWAHIPLRIPAKIGKSGNLRKSETYVLLCGLPELCWLAMARKYFFFAGRMMMMMMMIIFFCGAKVGWLGQALSQARSPPR